MSEKLQFFIPCIPPKTTAQAALRIMKRANGQQFVGKYDTSKGKRVQGELIALLRPHAPAEAMQGPLRLRVHWVYPWRKSEPKKNRAAGFRWCDTRPDGDNLLKMFNDVLSRLGFWGDDGQVADMRICKAWGDRPGIGVMIEECRTVAEFVAGVA